MFNNTRMSPEKMRYGLPRRTGSNTGWVEGYRAVVGVARLKLHNIEMIAVRRLDWRWNKSNWKDYRESRFPELCYALGPG